MISEETKAYYDLKKRNDVRESAKRIRRQFLRYKDAEIVYSLQHKKILELASEAGAIYRIYDCKGKSIYSPPVIDTSKIRGPCVPVDITIIAKEMFTYDPPNRRKIAV